MPPAARVTDAHVCNTVDPGPKPHGGGPIKPPCSTTVETDHLGQARATDQLQCLTPPPNFIVTGSTSVDVDGLMAARQTDKTMHPPPGSITVGSPDVEIGGPTGGATLGNPPVGTAACNLAATGRAGGSTQQTSGNCSLESARQVINQLSPPPAGNPGVTEQQIITQATATPSTANPGNQLATPTGGTRGPADQVTLMGTYGVTAHQETSTMQNLAQAVAERRGVTANLDAAPIWGGTTPVGSWHAVTVTGVQYDQNGNLINVIVNDTGQLPVAAGGTGNCGLVYSAANFQTALNSMNTGASWPGGGGNLVVTNNRVW